jgi:hypothetical protein
MLKPEQFSSGSCGQSNFELSGIGSTVKMKGEAVAEPAETKECTAKEARLIVADHLALRASVRQNKTRDPRLLRSIRPMRAKVQRTTR